MSEALITRTTPERVVLLNESWPDEILLSLAFLCHAKTDLVVPGPGHITFFLANGRATYRVERWDSDTHTLVARLVESELADDDQTPAEAPRVKAGPG